MGGVAQDPQFFPFLLILLATFGGKDGEQTGTHSPTEVKPALTSVEFMDNYSNQ